MWWKVEEYIDEEVKVLIYNYFDFVDTQTTKKPYFNGFMKEMIHPQTKELVIKAAIFNDHDEFLEWYCQSKNF